MSRSRSGSPRGGFERERPRGGDFGRDGGPPRSENLFSIKVDSMSLRTNKDDVRERFSKFGEIGDIFFPADKYTGSSRGFCFVRYFKEECAEEAVDHYGRSGIEIDGKTCNVTMATTRPRPGTDNWDPVRRQGRYEDRGRGFGGGRGGFGGGRDRGFDDRRDRSFGGGGGFDRRNDLKTRADAMFSIKVSNMSLRTNKDDIREKFDKFGEIGDLFFPPDRDTGASRGFCYVRFIERNSMLDAMDAYGRSGVEIDGKTCDVYESLPRNGGRGPRGGGFRDRDGGSRDQRDRYEDRGRGRSRSRSPRRSRSPAPRYRGRGDSRSPPRRRSRSRSNDYDRFRRRSPLDRRSRSRSPYRR